VLTGGETAEPPVPREFTQARTPRPMVRGATVAMSYRDRDGYIGAGRIGRNLAYAQFRFDARAFVERGAAEQKKSWSKEADGNKERLS